MAGGWQKMIRFVKGKMMRHMPDMITCVEFEAFILSYLDGTLPADQKRKFERHIQFCCECREYLAAYERTIEIEKLVFADANASPPEDVPEDLIHAILAAKGNNAP